MRSPAARTMLAAVAAALALAGCGGSNGDGAATPGNATGWEHTWVGETLEGAQLDAGALEGRDVVLWFWAPW